MFVMNGNSAQIEVYASEVFLTDALAFCNDRILFVDGCRQEKLHRVSTVWQLSRQADDAVPRELPEQRAANVPVQS